MDAEKIIALDKYIANLIQSNLTIDILAWAISISVIIVIASALYYWWYVKKDKETCFKLIFGGAVLFTILEIIKILVSRVRPNLEDSLSFPSRHVAIAVMMALFLPVDKTTKSLLIIWAVAVAASRIWLGKHWLSDVIVGAIIGGVAALVLVKWKLKIK